MPTPAPGGSCAPCRRCGSGCSTTTTALDGAEALVARLDAARIASWLRDDVPAQGLGDSVPAATALDLARETVAIAKRGLARRARIDWDGRDETRYLEPLERIAADGRTLAEARLDDYRGRWEGSVDRLFVEHAF